ncbi:hypothetical protein ALI22I_00460 [Saccharothrix sp. ALI-22-I]|uniref:HAD family hydrolase n=1 Tax=Saccharothrix sp. ALI-22-I TaxID=1933778 RepID=UPI00097C7F54|nr:HAD family phosphatase [Saccharothrix sp. ALI-22-I]ONI93028.1 hypothetical protein ALI22I_00460 [Saccharothrix sp. ALI-22-I]
MSGRAILFDFDGLICDTEHAAFTSWSRFYAEFGHAFPVELWRRMAGSPVGEELAVADLSARTGRPLDESLRERRRRLKHELAQAEPLRPGVLDFLTRASAQGLACAVVSSSHRRWVELHLHRLGVRHHFDLVVTGDMVTAPKPAPDVYRLALELMDLTAHDTIALEDSPVGVESAVQAGLAVVMVVNPHSSGDGSGAVAVLDSLEEVDPHDLLQQWAPPL